jgi:hypothetical protein
MRELLTLNDEVERGLRDQVVRPVLERGHGRCCIMIGRYGSAIESLRCPFVGARIFEMTNVQELELVLTRMAELLRLGSHGNWGDALEKHRSALSTDPAATVARILAMFGGMASLNDVILYEDRQPMANENRELDALRSKLYDLCHRV